MSPNPMITSKPIKLGSIAPPLHHQGVDRKSTRLNSSHGYISYAVFCLKKKKRIARGGREFRKNFQKFLTSEDNYSLERCLGQDGLVIWEMRLPAENNKYGAICHRVQI